MIKIDANFDLKPKTYDMRIDAKTSGIFEKILPWDGMFATAGTEGFKPIKHDYQVRWRSKISAGTFNYQPAGKFQSMTKTEDGKPRDEAIDSEITDNTSDLLSAVLTAFNNYEKNESCNADVLTFDNSRSFIVRFRDAGDGVMNNPKVSSYTGPAHACSVEIIPQKGKWPKKPRGWLRIQEEAKTTGKLPIIWIAKPTPDTPVIPVRVDIHTKYGDAYAHLVKLQ